MKKTLLLAMAVATCFGSAMAESKTPTIYPGASFQRISANGRYAVSYVYGEVGIYDLVEGTVVEFLQDPEDWSVSYDLGSGNCITADGSILLGSNKASVNAAYYENGEWHELSVSDPDMVNISNGITPDGSRICGTIGLSHISIDSDGIMQIPVYWDRNADGNGYGEYVILPHPDKDFFGETPQYVTAIAISSDGKVIAGQVQFGSGMMSVPIVYTQDAENNWSYSLPTKDLFNPDHLTAVENPGDGPSGPYYGDYMTEEELAAYNDACMNYDSESGADYPEIEDFMTPEKRAEYEAANEAYINALVEFNEKLDAYWEYYNAVKDASPNFLFNNVWLSTDNKKVVGSLESEGEELSWWGMPISVYIYTPCTVDIATGELSKADTNLSLLASGVADNGVILAYNGQNQTPMTGYVIQDGEVKDIADYIAAINPAYGEWIKENMTHTVEVGYDEEWNPILEDCTYTGMPVSTPDMSVITIWNDCPWDYENYAEGVVFEFTKTPTGISNIAAEKGSLKFANGTLLVPAGFVSVDIYNLSGACVKAVNKPAGAVKLDLSNGAYIAKGTRADGSVSVIKIAK